MVYEARLSYLILAVIACLGTAVVAPSASDARAIQVTPEPFRRSESLLASIPFKSDTLRVIGTKLHDDVAPRFDSTLCEVRVVDQAGTELYRESLLDCDYPGDTLEEEITLATMAFPFAGGLGIDLYLDASPSIASYPGDCRYLLIQTRIDSDEPRPVVRPVSAWCWVFRDHDRFEYLIDEGWFSALIPVEPRFDRPNGGFEPAGLERDSDLAVLQIQAYGKPSPHKQTQVRLFSTPVIDQYDSVLITPLTDITLGRGWFRTTGSCLACLENDDFSMDIVRLEVTIDGRKGFVEETDFGKLGLLWIN